jgi:hypothetical protein
MQLRFALLLLLVPAVAFADGEVSLRGVYYKERATRVMQPMLDGMLEVGTHGIVDGHFLVDAITSASSSSGAADTAFTERRIEGGLGYTHDFGQYRLGVTGKYSSEPDYKSAYAGVRGEVDLAQKNTTLGAGVGMILDEISAGQAQGLFDPMVACNPHKPTVFSRTCDMSAVTAFASASQILSRDMVAALTYDVSSVTGYQSNAYRQVLAGNAFAPERHPDSRLRQAFGASLRYYLRSTKTTLIGAYRYYRDNWKVRAQTPEVRIVQEAGRTVDFAVRYRYYRQTQAFFYKPRYDTEEEYMTDDTKLTKFDGHTVEAKLGVIGEAFGLEHRWSEMRFEGILEYVVQNNRFGNAIIAHVAVTIPFDF